MELTFYGVRGSIPAPGPMTQKYGGNTSCVHVRLNNGQNLVLDAGTGIRKLGQHLAQVDEPILLLLSHGHWDHIQGYPFFDPIYQKDRAIQVLQGVGTDEVSLEGLIRQMDGSNFPVHAADLPSAIETIDNISEFFLEQAFTTHRESLNHPGGGYAYRIEEDGVSIAYVTDNELDPPGETQTSYDAWVEFCSGVDVLIHDAQYLESDMPAKHGWGHSLISQVRQLAIDAEVGSLLMFHHDPERTDAELDEIALENERFFSSKKAPARSLIAAEGMRLSLAARRDPAVSSILVDS